MLLDRNSIRIKWKRTPKRMNTQILFTVASTKKVYERESD
ncbi:unnamed protein product, partial [Litomosoides sigmodontis]